MIKKIIPGFDRILFELDKLEEDVIARFTKIDGTEGKLYSPEQKRMPVRKATVLAVGKAIKAGEEDYFKIGDRIIVSWYTGRIVNDFDLGWNDERRKICRYNEVMAKIEE